MAAVQPDCTLRDPRGGVQGSIGGGVVSLSGGQSVPYDWLVLALGATSSVDVVPGAREHAIPFLTLDDVQRVQAALQHATAAARRQSTPQATPVRVAVVGASLAGVELAAAVASVLGDDGGDGQVLLLAAGGDIMPDNTDAQRAAARAALARARVEVVPFRRVASISAAAAATAAADESPAAGLRTVHFQAAATADASTPPPLDVDLVLWTAGQRPAGADLLGPGWLNDAIGRISTDATLRVRCVSSANLRFTLHHPPNADAHTNTNNRWLAMCCLRQGT